MRNIPPALKAHIDSGVTTLCHLLKIKLADGRQFGMATLDRDVEYLGLTYHAQNGFDSSIISTDESYKVDNGEAYSLYSTDIPGIDAAMVDRGELDGAEWEMFLINYNDTSMGHVIMDAGDIGEIKTVRNVIFAPELLSFVARLRQTIGHVDSKTCRAVFGKDGETQTSCGVNANALWQAETVTAISLEEPKITFFASALSGISQPARVRWTSGDNASSKLYQVERIEGVNGLVTLLEPLPFSVQIGDTFEIRPDCDKMFTTCRDVYNNMINFKGENLIPTGEPINTPGAGAVSGGGGFAGGSAGSHS